MNSAAHVLIGIFAFLGYSHWLGTASGSSTLSTGWGFVAVVIGSVIPDFIEPATSWRHRSLFHSFQALFAVIILFIATGLLALVIAFFSDFSAFFLLSCFFLGYVFHLLADSITPAGLPR
jgi:membrane-bound metal-dependent hydrolase YbcI (DUF457 family)